jgi:glycosyltransferase involved in cell wall biosynthesis
MKVIYDHQIFAMQNYGGISRYFFELMNYFDKDTEINSKLSIALSSNYYIDNCSFLPQNSTPISSIYRIPYIRKFLNLDRSKKILLKQDFDIFHPTYYDPYFLEYLGEKPFVLTIHDMIHEIFPEYFYLSDKTISWKRTLAEKANRIIAVSENTYKDIVKFMDISPNKITVIHHGASININNVNGTIDNKTAYQIPNKYILFVGARERYKNFYFLLESVAPILHRNKDLHLICAGGGAFSNGEIKFLKILDIGHKVAQYDVDDRMLIYLYKNALGFVFPSLYEGFGMPVLESFACGCPVIASCSSSIPEVGRDAIIYFNPKDVTDLRDSVDKVIYDDTLREKLKLKGYKQLKNFSWEKTAIETKKLYMSIK